MIKLYTYDESQRSWEEVSMGTFQKPVIVKAIPNGTRGVHKLWLRNDDALKTYSGIKLGINAQQTMTFIQSSSIQCRMLSGDAEPTEAEWDAAGPTFPLLRSPLDNGINTNRTKLPALEKDNLAYHPLWVSVVTSAPLGPGDYLYTIDITYTESLAE